MSRNSLLTRILVPLDGSERANAALALAAQLVSPSSELILAQVVPESRGIRDSIGNWRISAADMTRELTDLAENNLADASAAIARQHPGVAISTAVRIGEPARGILQIANDLDASMIVMASQGRGAFGRAVLGSVADKVFRLSSLPVLIQHDNGADFSGRPIHRIVVPLDGSDLAESAIPPATTVASALGLPLHLLSIVDPTRSSSAPGCWPSVSSLSVPLVPTVSICSSIPKTGQPARVDSPCTVKPPFRSRQI